MKRPFRGVAFLAVVALVAMTPQARNSHASGTEERNIEKNATKRVQPSYPTSAQQYKIQGEVMVLVTVAQDGKVAKAEFIRGNNVFRSVSLDAAKRWQFRIPENNLEGTIRFVFKLREQ